MRLVGGVRLGVPPPEAHQPRYITLLHYPAQHHRTARPPLPPGIHPEKPGHQLGCAVVGIQLAGPGDQDSPGDTAEKTEDIGIDAPVLGPDLDEPQGVLVRRRVGYQAQDHVSHPAPVDTPGRSIVHILQQVVVHQATQVPWNHGEGELGEEQIDIHPIKHQLDNGGVGVGHSRDAGDLRVSLQLGDQGLEKSLPINVPRGHAQRINIRPWVDDPQAVGAEGENLSPSLARGVVALPLLDAHLHDPLLNDFLQLSQHPLPLLHPLRRLRSHIVLQVRHHHRRRHQVVELRLRQGYWLG
mmetsp:Transcript_116202/g.266743  ORF Transcript_116202/g.266743 Transcript_116202/m.266743 type:complete len:298 (-) Transcript_116202:37-930(-)